MHKRTLYNDFITNSKTIILKIPKRKKKMFSSFEAPDDVIPEDTIVEFSPDTKFKLMVDKATQTNNMVDKATQKNYEKQAHDMYPDEYHRIDAEAKAIKNEKQTQTYRWILKALPSPPSSKMPSPPSSESESSSSSSSSTDKPPTPIKKKPPPPPKPQPTPEPTPPPSSSSGEEGDEEDTGGMDYWEWTWNMMRPHLFPTLPTPPRSITPPSPAGIPLTDEQMRARSRSHSSRNSSITGVASSWNSRQIAQRSRSHSSNEGFTPSWSSRQLRERSRSRDS